MQLCISIVWNYIVGDACPTGASSTVEKRSLVSDVVVLRMGVTIVEWL